ncbi:MAG: oxidase [Chitinophagaceae bacterium]|nr:MAG: oxidase [Chitinophagaceae bacterium]
MKDILIDNETFDLQIMGGDFLIGDPSQQCQQLLLFSKAGEWKEYPTAGIGIENYLLDENPADLKRAVRIGLNADGMKVDQVIIDQSGKIGISGSYDN